VDYAIDADEVGLGSVERRDQAAVARKILCNNLVVIVCSSAFGKKYIIQVGVQIGSFRLYARSKKQASYNDGLSA